MDEGGTIAYGEIKKSLENRFWSLNPDCKRFLTAMSFERAGHKVELDTASWKLKATDRDQLLQLLQAKVKEANAKVSDLYDALSLQGTVELTKTAFVMGMERIGFKGDSQMLLDLFDDVDLDDSGEIGIDEICERQRLVSEPHTLRI